MMEFKGTKGTWEVNEKNEVISINRMGRVLMKFKPFTPSGMIDKSKENALLMACAPELLQALQGFVTAIENEDIVIYDNIDHDGFASTPSRLYNEAKKAIEKALK